MSRFKIYQINHYDPQIVGRKKRRLAASYGIITVFILFLYHMAVNIIGVKFFLFYSIAFPLILGLSIYLQYRLKSDLKKIKTIGDIEFTRTGIRKRIGDSLTEYEFHSIAKLELQKHIPAVTAGDGKSGYFSYILKIIFNNSSSESLVISDKPTDTKQDLSVVDTMKTLKKIIKSQISIES